MSHSSGPTRQQYIVGGESLTGSLERTWVISSHGLPRDGYGLVSSLRAALLSAGCNDPALEDPAEAHRISVISRFQGRRVVQIDSVRTPSREREGIAKDWVAVYSSGSDGSLRPLMDFETDEGRDPFSGSPFTLNVHGRLYLGGEDRLRNYPLDRPVTDQLYRDFVIARLGLAVVDVRGSIAGNQDPNVGV